MINLMSNCSKEYYKILLKPSNLGVSKMKIRMFFSITILITFILVITRFGMASVVYDFETGIQTPTQLNGLTSFKGTIETQQLGTFTNEFDIENFLNNSVFIFHAIDGGSIAFTLDNSNSA